MNNFTLSTKYLKTIKSIIDHYLPIKYIELIVDKSGIEFILINNTLTLRWKIQKVSIINFKVKQKITTIIQLGDFQTILNNIDLNYLMFKQWTEQMEVLNKENSLGRFNTNQMPQQGIEIPPNQEEYVQINIKWSVFQKIISEYQFSNQDIQIEIQQKHISFLKNHQEIIKIQYQPTSEEQCLELCKSAFSIMDTIVQTQKKKNQIQLSFYQNQIQQLYFEDEFIQVNLLSHTKTIELPKFNSFIIRQGQKFLKILQKIHSLISNTLTISVTQNIFEITHLDKSDKFAIQFEIGKTQLNQFIFQQEVSENFDISPIFEKFKLNKKRSLQLKINSSTLIVIDMKTKDIVELFKANIDKFEPEDIPIETIIKLKKSQLLPISNALSTDKTVKISVLQDRTFIKYGDEDLINDIKVISHDNREKNVSFDSEQIQIYRQIPQDFFKFNKQKLWNNIILFSKALSNQNYIENTWIFGAHNVFDYYRG